MCRCEPLTSSKNGGINIFLSEADVLSSSAYPLMPKSGLSFHQVMVELLIDVVGKSLAKGMTSELPVHAENLKCFFQDAMGFNPGNIE